MLFCHRPWIASVSRALPSYYNASTKPTNAGRANARAAHTKTGAFVTSPSSTTSRRRRRSAVVGNRRTVRYCARGGGGAFLSSSCRRRRRRRRQSVVHARHFSAGSLTSGAHQLARPALTHSPPPPPPPGWRAPRTGETRYRFRPIFSLRCETFFHFRGRPDGRAMDDLLPPYPTTFFPGRTFIYIYIYPPGTRGNSNHTRSLVPFVSPVRMGMSFSSRSDSRGRPVYDPPGYMHGVFHPPSAPKSKSRNQQNRPAGGARGWAIVDHTIERVNRIICRLS